MLLLFIAGILVADCMHHEATEILPALLEYPLKIVMNLPLEISGDTGECNTRFDYRNAGAIV